MSNKIKYLKKCTLSSESYFSSWEQRHSLNIPRESDISLLKIILTTHQGNGFTISEEPLNSLLIFSPYQQPVTLSEQVEFSIIDDSVPDFDMLSEMIDVFDASILCIECNFSADVFNCNRGVFMSLKRMGR